MGRVRSISRAFFAALIALCPIAAHAATAPDPAGYKGALVVDFSEGEVLYQDRVHEPVDPASLVKMMVVLIAMEQVEQGVLQFADSCKVSARASRIGGHQVYLKQGEVFSLGELLKAVMMASANDAAFAVAERIGGSQEQFVGMMNVRARQLGMHDTRFMNPHGLPPDRRKGEQANYSSAYDLALLARALMRYPAAKKWASTRNDTFRQGKFILTNTNLRFLQRFEGADGFKTGYHPRGAGFSLVATAERDRRRLLAVVVGAKNPTIRLRTVSALLESAFKGSLGPTGMTFPPADPIALIE